MRLGVLGSTRGTDLHALVEGIQQKKIFASIPIVISNKKEAYILKRATQQGLNSVFVDPSNLSREQYDQEITYYMQKHKIDLIVLIGYMRVLSDEFIRVWRNKIINVHPSLLPDFAGGMDLDVHQAVLAAGRKETGATVHYVTENLDAGPVLVQKKCSVFPHDTAESLKQRVQTLEGIALVEAIRGIQNGSE